MIILDLALELCKNSGDNQKRNLKWYIFIFKDLKYSILWQINILHFLMLLPSIAY